MVEERNLSRNELESLLREDRMTRDLGVEFVELDPARIDLRRLELIYEPSAALPEEGSPLVPKRDPAPGKTRDL